VNEMRRQSWSHLVLILSTSGLLFVVVIFGPVSNAEASVGAWTAAPAPLPSNGGTLPLEVGGYLASIACPSASFCVTVGQYENTGNEQQPHGLIDSLLGGNWSALEAPLPSNAYLGVTPNTAGSWLQSVACISTNDCVAVGGYSTTASQSEGVIETLASDQWSPMEAPIPSDTTDTASASLSSVVCTTDGECLARGFHENAAQLALVPFVETFFDGTWDALDPPLPSNAIGSALGINTIACESTSTCVAVGNYETGDNTNAGYLDTFSQGTWTSTQTPEPLGSQVATTSLQAAGCTSDSCTAVGQGLVEQLSQGVWHALAVPVSSAFSLIQWASVSCSSDEFCSGVGSGLFVLSQLTEALVETPNGGGWTTESLPLPTNASTSPGSAANAVVCVSDSDCVAVGAYWSSADPGLQRAFISQFDGTSWQSVAAPTLLNVPVSDYGLTSLSCGDLASCVVVGFSQGGGPGIIETEGPMSPPAAAPEASTIVILPAMAMIGLGMWAVVHRRRELASRE